MLARGTRQVIHVHTIVDRVEVDHQVSEGEVQMMSHQVDYYKQLIGDGQASVTVSRELSESNYGSGGKVFISITLTCDQSAQGLESAIAFAKNLAEDKAWSHHAELRNQLVQKGLLRG